MNNHRRLAVLRTNCMIWHNPNIAKLVSLSWSQSEHYSAMVYTDRIQFPSTWRSIGSSSASWRSSRLANFRRWAFPAYGEALSSGSWGNSYPDSLLEFEWYPDCNFGIMMFAHGRIKRAMKKRGPK